MPANLFARRRGPGAWTKEVGPPHAHLQYLYLTPLAGYSTFSPPDVTLRPLVAP
jgi:hypothetical protein